MGANVFAHFYGYQMTGNFTDFQQFNDLISRARMTREAVNGKNRPYSRPIGLNSEPHNYYFFDFTDASRALGIEL